MSVRRRQPTLEFMSTNAVMKDGGRGDADLLVASYDGIHLLFRKCEVKSVEMLDDVESSSPEGTGALRYRHGESECPVVALDGNFGILPSIPARRQHFILLASEKGELGIACDQTSLLREADARLMPLPDCMQSEESPIQGVALIADAIGFFCSSSALAACLFPTSE